MSLFDSTGRLIIPVARETLQSEHQRVAKAGKLVVCQLFCQEGHALIDEDNAKFEGLPGIKLLCAGAGMEQIVIISPIYGDFSKVFERSYPEGTVLDIRCPECRSVLPALAPHECRPGAMYVSLFLDRTASVRNSANICNVWGCSSSFVRLYDEVIHILRQDCL